MKKYLFSIILFISSFSAIAQDKLELEITVIQGNKELPQILYVVPWQESKAKKNEERSLVLHSLFGNYFDPVEPEDFDK